MERNENGYPKSGSSAGSNQAPTDRNRIPNEDYGAIATIMNALGQNIISAWNSLQKSE